MLTRGLQVLIQMAQAGELPGEAGRGGRRGLKSRRRKRSLLEITAAPMGRYS